MAQKLTAAAERRWDELLENIVSLIPDGIPAVISCPSDEDATRAGLFADRISEALAVACVPCPRHAPPVNGRRPEPVVIQLRTTRRERAGADIVVDVGNPDWPVIRAVSDALATRR